MSLCNQCIYLHLRIQESVCARGLISRLCKYTYLCKCICFSFLNLRSSWSKPAHLGVNLALDARLIESPCPSCPASRPSLSHTLRISPLAPAPSPPPPPAKLGIVDSVRKFGKFAGYLPLFWTPSCCPGKMARECQDTNHFTRITGAD